MLPSSVCALDQEALIMLFESELRYKTSQFFWLEEFGFPLLVFL